ncbi:reelin domain-containing protein 1-like isoform X1 [Ctenopharyngodon idella]|uniref:reelin domain-containing protein 1-like isoform X1 n=2 Tax=Ctenopharyngodon idella TaxID=7959 RepID=UPI00222EC618|nr:reelin domain-containing protein 1-like isoform X1 [Ctenopharyngodon idella]XP_051735038.1 reelin domain-containing protein 1-like isoform X1 [Ctenopharyngodon idella]XP_051735039.1 reelin domain-containing protein 1-like isoform X1 [Ctenopharyngodon idella]XP_051735040.1 reelin domain-containing protein 1-like isoform X1 [Ctenopharyngodon idella]XP_051735041.1 reelin domain-containing protein 1-like isoform X1 [Ctenopharyngodon idella]XP_051735042.1 reelin domain-containing protein 1-like 
MMMCLILPVTTRKHMMMMKMKMMKAVLAGCVIICVFPGRGVCFSRGASVSSCVNMKPGHISSFPQHTRTHSSVTIRSSRSVYLPQHTLTVTVQSSRAFMGFLLQARSVLEDRVVGGEFTLHPPSTHTLSCLSTDDTVTHSDKMLKRNLSFSWRAPTQPSGDLRFYITLVQSYFVYWSRIRSAVVHDGTRSSQITDSVTGQPTVNTTASILEQTGKHTSLPTYTTTSTHTNTHAPYNTNTNTLSTFSSHTTTSFNTQSINNTQTSLSSYRHTSTQTFPSMSSSQSIYSSTNAKTDTNTHTTTATSTHTVPSLLLQTHSTDTHISMQQTHTYTPSVHTRNTQIFTASLHPEALRRALSDFFPSREPTEADVSLTQRKKDPSNLFGDVVKPPKHAKDPSGVPERGGERPERVPGQSASELGLLLGLSASLGMAVAVGLRYLQRKHCRKRTAVSLNDCNHEDRGIIHVQECGDLVQVRKIRQNSFLVLQAEYNLITPTGN